MASRQSNVLIHVDRDSIAAGEVAAALQARPGVTRTRLAPRSPQLVLVDYDPRRVTAQDLLAGIRRRGIGARLIGM